MKLKNHEIASEFSKIAGLIRMPNYFYDEVIMLANIKGKERILDVGCGNGYLLERIKNNYSHVQLYGIELSHELFKKSKKRLHGKATVLRGLGEKTNFSNGFFDIIFITEVLEHTKNPEKILDESKRLLKEGGKIIVTFPNIHAFFPFYLFDTIIPDALKSVLLPDEHPFNSLQPIDRIFTLSEIKKIIKRIKLKEKKRFGVQYFPWLSVNQFMKEIMQKKRPTINSIFSALNLHFLAYRMIILLNK